MNTQRRDSLYQRAQWVRRVLEARLTKVCFLERALLVQIKAGEAFALGIAEDALTVATEAIVEPLENLASR